jgi:hypothetical protein
VQLYHGKHYYCINNELYKEGNRTFCDVHHVGEHVPHDVELIQQHEQAESIDAGQFLKVDSVGAQAHVMDLLRLLLDPSVSAVSDREAVLWRAPPGICPEGVVGAEVSAVMDADIVARRVRIEEAFAPVAAMLPSVLHGSAFAHSWVITHPEQQDRLEPEDAGRVVGVLGVVDRPEAFCLTPHELIDEDSHERVHALWVPKRAHEKWISST